MSTSKATVPYPAQAVGMETRYCQTWLTLQIESSPFLLFVLSLAPRECIVFLVVLTWWCVLEFVVCCLQGNHKVFQQILPIDSSLQQKMVNFQRIILFRKLLNPYEAQLTMMQSLYQNSAF